jgi:hypothetical protein
MNSIVEPVLFKKCTSCRCFRDAELFGDFKTCDICRTRKRKTSVVVVPEIHDDDMVYTKETRNWFVRKISELLPAGSFKFLGCEGDIWVVLTESKCALPLDTGDTWRHIKKWVTKDREDGANWECPICFCPPKNMQVSTCEKCLTDMCTVCFLDIFQNNRGIVACPWCRDIAELVEVSPELAATVAHQMRINHGLV